MTDHDHPHIEARLNRHETRLDRVEDRTDRMEGRWDKMDGMMWMIRAIFGVSLVGAITGVLALAELIFHAANAAPR